MTGATNVIQFPGTERVLPHEAAPAPIPGVEIDNDSFNNVAEILYRINPAMRDGYGSIAGIKQYMIDETIKEHLRLGWWGIGGFTISVHQQPTVPTFYLEARVEAHMVLSFLNREFPVKE